MSDYNFSAETKNAIKIAESYAKESMNEAITPAHLLKAVLHKDAGLVQFLENAGKDYYYLLDWASARLKMLPKSATPFFDLTFSDESLAVIDEADSIKMKYESENIEPIVLLAALVTPGVGFTFEQLKTLPLSAEDLLAHLNAPTSQKSQKSRPSATGGSSNSNILKYCIDKCFEAKEGYQPLVIGFEKEMQAIFETLGKKSKSNVLLVGESGIGKTALIDAFVQRIIHGEVPDFLTNNEVYELDLSVISS
jgi:ATP-dependent Clp protease ATP-binding subunit ClpA